MALNQATMVELQLALQSDYFSSEDFVINDLMTSRSVFKFHYSIQYRFSNKYYFKFWMEVDGRITLLQSPGDFLNEETFTITTKETLFNYIDDWLQLIKDDIHLSPTHRELQLRNEEFQAKLGDIEQRLEDFEDSYFSKKESEDFHNRLNDLEAMFREKISENQDNNNELTKELEKLTQEMDMLKKQLSSLTKANWVKSFASKMFNWGKRNPKAVMAIGGVARELLPQDIKQHIPAELLQLESAATAEQIEE